ncbi:homoserine dehydrogenase [Helicobacter monodelphidis]|uniref:homoserine dehydrogenase n=1 Tax=Helicobacter sp. 15-1451 TaxID=2004995 RepID=UPI0015EC6BB2|nr:homoserine dehydrogenase [Helicobacter sp. 15-1451]
MMRIGIVGVGVVGSSVVRILQQNKEVIAARAGEEIIPVKGVVRSLGKQRNVDISLYSDIESVLNDDSIDTIVELMGGVDEAFIVAKKTLGAKKRLVTANKALLAYHRYELQEIAGEIPIGFEASVAGGIPIIKALRDGLGANHILEISGILNGTCNYILTKMLYENIDYATALQEAQHLGYAEADPVFDVGGIDAAHKLLILASLAYGIDAKPDDILIEGITKISNDEIAFAREFGYSIKLLGIAKRQNNQVELRIHPAFIKNAEMLSRVDGVMNGISVVGDCVGETMFYGAGAGGDATASAVISDLIEIARSKGAPMLGFKKPFESGLYLRSQEEIQSRYYLKAEVADKTGVLAQIAKILSEEDISINSLLQQNGMNDAKILLSTHYALEKNIKCALKRLGELPVVLSEPLMIRIKD